MPIATKIRTAYSQTYSRITEYIERIRMLMTSLYTYITAWNTCDNVIWRSCILHPKIVIARNKHSRKRTFLLISQQNIIRIYQTTLFVPARYQLDKLIFYLSIFYKYSTGF